jgi:serine/threonine protein kinase
MESRISLGVGSEFGGYQIVGLLGTGGMGEVYRARDPRLERLIALKVIAPDFATNATWRERFRREARALATLSHPNIATVYAVEEDDSTLALSMELVEGDSLKELVRPGGMATERLLKVAVQIADALSAAHQRGITHRDLKPANVIVSTDGRVKVLDFGLAKLAEAPEATSGRTTAAVSELTAEGYLVGTPAYMSPEQAEGRPVDYRSDIFSFGILLYEMATGELPFKGQSVLSILSAIVRDQPRAPLEINPRLPRQLARTIWRCLAKDPEERYQSAKDLRNDLTDLRQELTSGELAGFPIASRPSRWWRRLTLASACLALPLGGWLVGRALNRPAAAFVPERIVQLTFDPGFEMSPSLSPDGKWVVYARRLGERSDIFLHSVGGENPINLTKDMPGDSDQPVFSQDGESIAFRSQSDGGGLFVMGRTGELRRRVTDAGFSPSWSPDGKWLAYSTDRAGDFPSTHPGGAELWIVEVDTGEKRRLNAVDALQPAWSPDGTRIAYWGVDPATHQRDLWSLSVADGNRVQVTNDSANDISPAWSSDGRALYFASDRTGTVNLWRIGVSPSSGRPSEPAQAVTVPGVYAVHPSVSKDGNRLAYATVSRTTNVLATAFDPETMQVQGVPRSLLGGQQDWSAARVSPDGSQLALVRWGHQQDLFVINTDGTGLRRLTSDPLGVRCPEWSPDSARLVYMRSLQTRGSLVLVNVRNGNVEPLSIGDGDVSGLGCPGWSPDGRRMTVAKSPPKPAAYILDLTRSPSSVAVEQLPPPAAGAFIPRAWSRDGQSLSGTIGSRVAIYSIATRKYETVTEPGVAVGASLTHWLPDGRHILFMGRSGLDLQSVNVGTKDVRPVLALRPPQAIRGASVTHDGRQLFYSQGQEEGEIWMATLPTVR